MLDIKCVVVGDVSVGKTCFFVFSSMLDIKCVVVGDVSVGKTCMLMSYTTYTFPTEYIPTVFENHQVTVEVDGTDISLSIYDTAGQERYDMLRPLSYDLADVFLICFAVNSETSLVNVSKKWAPELKHYAPDVPFLLIGTKCDMRNEVKDMVSAPSAEQKSEMEYEAEGIVTPTEADQKPEPEDVVSASSAKQIAEKVGAAAYFECSAYKQESLQQIFDQAIRIARRAANSKPKRRRRCDIL